MADLSTNLLTKWTLAQAIAADASVSPSALRVALRLLDHWNTKTGRCDPSYSTVGAALGMGRRTVIEAVQNLERAGWLRVERVSGGDPNATKGFATNTFAFVVDKLGDLPRVEEEDTPPVQVSTLPPGAETSTPPGAHFNTTPVLVSTPPRGARFNTQNNKPSNREPNPGKGNEETPFPLKAPGDRKKTPDRDEEISLAFEPFWREYPKRVARGAAIAAFAKAVRAGIEPDLIVSGARRYARERMGQDDRFTKHPATWLNGQCWDDAPASPSSSASPGPITLDGDGNVVASPTFTPADTSPNRRKTNAELMLEGITDEWLAQMEAVRISRHGH